MNKYINGAIYALMILLLVFSVIPNNPLYYVNWALFSGVILCLTLITFFTGMDRQRMTSKEVAFIATISSLAAVFRIPFAFIPSVQPTTFIVMITGYLFGARKGFLVGAIAALVSNFFLGQGPWTPWQMFAWGMSGVSAAIIGYRKESFNWVLFTILTGIWGYLFGWIMNIYYWVGFVYPLTFKTFTVTYLTSFPMDTMHAAGNVIFALIFGKSFYAILSRFKDKMFYIKIE